MRRLEEFKGKAVLLNLWATWCAPCRKEMPTLETLQKKEGGSDFAVVALSLDDGNMDKPKDFFRENRISSLPLFHDGKGSVFQTLRNAGLLMGFPTSFLLNRDGCVLGVLKGPANWSSDEALKLIDSAKKPPQ